MFLRAVSAFACVLVLFACSSPTGSSKSANESGASAAAGPNKAQMDGWWKLYQAGDPKWPAARQRWSAYGGSARTTLILSLVRELVVAAGVRNPDGSLAHKKPQAELLALPADDVIPVLIETIRIGKHATALDALSTTIAETGRDEAVIAALESPKEGDSSQSAPTLLKTLIRIGGAHALSAVEKQLLTASDWQVRAAAAEACRLAHVSDHPIVIKTLAKGLDDADGFVVRTSLKSLSSIGDVHATSYVARAFEKIAEGSDKETKSEAIATLRSLSGRIIEGNDPKRWQEIAVEVIRDADAKKP